VSFHADSLATAIAHPTQKCPSAGNSKQLTNATTVELCLSLSSDNAVKTQIWCALIAIIKKEPQRDASLYTCLQILSVFIFEKTDFMRPAPNDAARISPLAPDEL
jgi:hypothetical protein